MNDLTISIIQASLHWEAVNANLAMFEEKIWQISSKTDVIILPEMFSTGFTMNVKNVAEPVGGKTYQWMLQMSKLKQAVIVGSYSVKQDRHYYNRLYAVYPNGTSAHYDKKHLFSLANEHTSYTCGTQKVVFDVKGWKMCPLICYDLRFPVWSRVKHPNNSFEYDVLIYVANWPVSRIEAWQTLLSARAIENMIYCIGVNRIGNDANDMKYSGCSAIYSFDGSKMVDCEDKEKCDTTTLSYSSLQQYRDRLPFYLDADDFSVEV